MPLLLCPNDNGSMQTVRRGGVEFDMCPTCRGVWLDRGELEKLMVSDATPPSPASFTQPQEQQPTQYRPRDSDDDDRRSHDSRDYSGKPRKKSSIFDIFD